MELQTTTKRSNIVPLENNTTNTTKSGSPKKKPPKKELKKIKYCVDHYSTKLRILGYLIFLGIVIFDAIVFIGSEKLVTETDVGVCCEKICDKKDKSLKLMFASSKKYESIYRMNAQLPHCSSSAYDCDAPPWFRAVIPVVSLSDCNTPESVNFFTTIMDPGIHGINYRLYLGGVNGVVKMSDLNELKTKCVTFNIHPFNTQLGTYDLHNPLQQWYIVNGDFMNTVLTDLQSNAMDAVMKEYYLTFLETFLNLFVDQFTHVSSYYTEIVERANDFSPMTYSSRDDVILAWDKPQNQMNVKLNYWAVAHTRGFPKSKMCSIRYGYNMTNTIPNPSGNLNHFAPVCVNRNRDVLTAADMFGVLYESGLYTGDNVVTSRIENGEIECTEACAQLSVTDCLVFKKPGDLETILHIGSFAGAMLFLCSLFDGFILRELLKKKHKVDFVYETHDGKLKHGNVLLM